MRRRPRAECGTAVGEFNRSRLALSRGGRGIFILIFSRGGAFVSLTSTKLTPGYLYAAPMGLRNSECGVRNGEKGAGGGGRG